MFMRFFVGLFYILVISVTVFLSLSFLPKIWLMLVGLPEGADPTWFMSSYWHTWLTPISYLAWLLIGMIFAGFYYANWLPGCRKTPIASSK